MKLDEAIQHCLDVYKTNQCEKCANEHKQLAEWLSELQQFKILESQGRIEILTEDQKKARDYLRNYSAEDNAFDNEYC